MLERAKRLAESPAAVLVRGENGVGKTLLASLLHYLGPNAGEPLDKIDCAGLPPELTEGELFGWERDELSGEQPIRRGRLEAPERGTVVLDEIAALSMPLQSKLLRAIEEKRFQRSGGARAIPGEARIIALTITG